MIRIVAVIAVAVAIQSSASAQSYTGTWIAELSGTTYVRLELQGTTAAMTGRLGLGNIQTDGKGAIIKVAAAPRETHPLQEIVRRDTHLSFILKEGRDSIASSCVWSAQLSRPVVHPVGSRQEGIRRGGHCRPEADSIEKSREVECLRQRRRTPSRSHRMIGTTRKKSGVPTQRTCRIGALYWRRSWSPVPPSRLTNGKPNRQYRRRHNLSSQSFGLGSTSCRSTSPCSTIVGCQCGA